jgi:hypothetical protein
MTVRARFSLTASSSLSPQFLEAIRVTASWRPVLYRGWPEWAGCRRSPGRNPAAVSCMHWRTLLGALRADGLRESSHWTEPSRPC